MHKARTNILKKIGIVIVCICILSYSIYHFASLFSQEIGTIVAGPTTESSFLTLDGYIFRDSEYVRSDYRGAADYAVKNGEKVAVGDKLARVYSEGNAENVRGAISLIEKKISLLKESTDNKLSVSALASLRAEAAHSFSSSFSAGRYVAVKLWKYAINFFAPFAFTFSIAKSIWVFIGSSGLGTKSPLPLSEQKIHPPFPLLPSRLGQVLPPAREILYTFSPKSFL